MSASEKLSRRSVLRGMLGGGAVTVALPFLDCMLNSNGTALAATGQALPSVFGTWFWGLGFNPGFWEPKTVGAFTEVGPELAPLKPYLGKMNVYTGLKVFLDGRPAITHFTGNWATLTGTTPREQRVTIPTIDGLVADAIGNRTRFRSLEVASTGNPQHSYSRRAGNALNPAEGSPVALYARIFGPEFKDPNAADFTPDPAVMARQSVLSAVKDQRDDMMKLLGASDRARLDEYFTSLRQVEQQLDLELQRPAPLEACSMPAKQDEVKPATEIGAVVHNHKLFAKLIAHAVACGQTRVFNITFSDATSSLRQAGSQLTQHIHTHEEPVDRELGYQPQATWFINRAMEGLATFVETMNGIKEGSGTLLDRTLVLASSDTGYARVHSVENMPLMTIGSGGGRMKTGIHVQAVGDPSTRVGLTVQQALGLPINSWGTDSMQTDKTITEVLA